MAFTITNQPCPMCSSSDAFNIDAEGKGYCFSCQGSTSVHSEQVFIKTERVKKMNMIEGEVQALNKRGITEETCKKFGYKVGDYKDSKWHIAPYYRDGQLVAQHIRSSSKDFKWLGESHDVELFGQHLWKESGKMVVVTEGEIDAMTVSQLQGNKWPVVSIPSGAASAKKSIQRNLEWLEGFTNVILMFDMDDAGVKAVEQCVDLFSPGKCKVASLPFKDANECLLKGKGEEVINAVWNAKTHRPDGVISGEDTWDMIIAEETQATSTYPWEDINGFLSGIRKGELVTVTAGSGIGKSLFCREVAYHLLKAGEKVGYVALEENVKRTITGFMGMELNQPLHINKEGITDDELKAAWNNTAGTGNLYLYDHWGSTDSDNLISRLRYLARGCGCSFLVLDHISIVVSGIGEGDERRLIDNTMTKLRSLVEETGVGLLLVSHLKRPEGNKGHEEGLHTSLSHLRGSASIAQLSDIVIGLERNQQGDKPDDTIVRVLKNRFSGITGEAGHLTYEKKTGRLRSAEGISPFHCGLDAASEF